jgi:hypothetical protein
MRSRYRLYVCPQKSCAAVGKNTESICPTHEQAMVPVIVRVEDAADRAIRAERSAKQVAAAGARVGEAAGKPGDPLGMAGVFRGMAEDIEMGRPSRYADADLDDDDIEEDEDE